MAWMSLKGKTTWDEAWAIAEKYPEACVSLCQRPYNKKQLIIRPIVIRRRVGDRWYNYYDNTKSEATNEYSITKADVFGGKEPKSYAPYYYVPDGVYYRELLVYIKEHLWRFRGQYTTQLHYRSETGDDLLYAVYYGVLQTVLTTAFDNPIYNFVYGRCLD